MQLARFFAAPRGGPAGGLELAHEALDELREVGELRFAAGGGVVGAAAQLLGLEVGDHFTSKLPSELSLRAFVLNSITELSSNSWQYVLVVQLDLPLPRSPHSASRSLSSSRSASALSTSAWNPTSSSSYLSL